MDEHIRMIDVKRLLPLVRKAIGNVSAEISTFHITPVHGGWGGAVGGTAIYRFTGQTKQQGAWSLILKILYPRPAETAQSPRYWKREYEICHSGLINQLPAAGLTVPTIYKTEMVDGAGWIWMEDIRAEKAVWTLADYQQVAERLGRFNALYVVGDRPIPHHNWLSSNWHCALMPTLSDTFANFDQLLQHPLAQRTLPLSEKATIQKIWQQANRYCAVLAALPQTFCHYDAFRRNIFLRDDAMILIDWALAGRGALGEELVSLVSLALYFNEQPIADADALDAAVFSGYIAGLRAGGWQGDVRLVRLGYTCAMTLRGLAGVKQDCNLLQNPQKHAQLRQLLKRQDSPEAMQNIADFFAQVRRFRLLKMSAEAQQLMTELDF